MPRFRTPKWIAFALPFLFLTAAYSAGDKWIESEYGSTRSHKDLQFALASKCFAWLSGSPADNEILSIGKNAQLFGFVALRLESGRAANRGALGRAFYSIATPEQRQLMEQAVRSELNSLEAWWGSRNQILPLLENHLYSGEPLEGPKLKELSILFGRTGAAVALHEARAYAAVEDLLTEAQWIKLRQWRANPELASQTSKKARVESELLKERKELKQLEDLYAKCFSWLTGKEADNRTIPLGQPAQFFGFVAIRHKSGHAASRAKIAKSFLAILDEKQIAALDNAIEAQRPFIESYFIERNLLLDQLMQLRQAPDAFDEAAYFKRAETLGKLEIAIGIYEARAYRLVRQHMTAEQETAMMKIRGDYIIDREQIESITASERGKQLAMLCAGCHGALGTEIPKTIAPGLEKIFERKIASESDFDYSQALTKLGEKGRIWDESQLDAYIAAPKSYAPGTKMEFQGLLNVEDRKALIDFLKTY